MDYDLLKEKLRERFPSPTTGDVNWLQFGKAIGYSHSGIERTFRNQSLNVITLEQICTVINYPVGYFFEKQTTAYKKNDEAAVMVSEPRPQSLMEINIEILSILKKHFK